MTFFPIPHNFHQILSLFPVATTSKRLMSKNVVICMCPSFAFFLYFSFILLSTIKGDFLRKKQNLLPKLLTYKKLKSSYSTMKGFSIRLQNTSMKPMQDERVCIRSLRYLLDEIQDLGHVIHQLGS